MNSEDFILIQGWMAHELGLSGTELIVYATIYSYSRDGSGEFKGSLSYLADISGASRSTVQRALKSLCDKGLIRKREVEVNNVQFSNYSIEQGIVKMTRGYSQNDHPYINNKINPLDKNSFDISNDISHSFLSVPQGGNTQKEGDQPPLSAKFRKPTVEEIRAYCEEKGYQVDAERFWAHYESNGWKVGGKAAMKSWKAAVVTWVKNAEERGKLPEPEIRKLKLQGKLPSDYRQDQPVRKAVKVDW